MTEKRQKLLCFIGALTFTVVCFVAMSIFKDPTPSGTLDNSGIGNAFTVLVVWGAIYFALIFATRRYVQAADAAGDEPTVEDRN